MGIVKVYKEPQSLEVLMKLSLIIAVFVCVANKANACIVCPPSTNTTVSTASITTTSSSATSTTTTTIATATDGATGRKKRSIDSTFAPCNFLKYLLAAKCPWKKAYLEECQNWLDQYGKKCLP